MLLLLVAVKIVIQKVFATKKQKQKKKLFGLNSRGHMYIYAYKI